MGTMATLLILFSLCITLKSQSNITTIFQCDVTWDSGAGGNMFDLENTGSEPLNIQQFTIHMNTVTTQTITIYTKTGSYIGYTNDAAAWTQIYSDSVTGAGNGNPTPLTPLPTALTIQPGVLQAFFIHSSQWMCDTTGTTVGDPYVNDGNIAIEIGIAIRTFGSSQIYSPYIWNGIIYYSLPTAAPTKPPTKTPTISGNPTKLEPNIVPTSMPTIVQTLSSFTKSTVNSEKSDLIIIVLAVLCVIGFCVCIGVFVYHFRKQHRNKTDLKVFEQSSNTSIEMKKIASLSNTDTTIVNQIQPILPTNDIQQMPSKPKGSFSPINEQKQNHKKLPKIKGSFDTAGHIEDGQNVAQQQNLENMYDVIDPNDINENGNTHDGNTNNGEDNHALIVNANAKGGEEKGSDEDSEELFGVIEVQNGDATNDTTGGGDTTLDNGDV